MTAPNISDYAAPPVIRLMHRRALIVGGVAAVISVVLAFLQPREFFSAYLLGYMLCLGVALGSMVVLMLRHLTGGAWGMVIRRILGAAMRTIPGLAVLFIPIVFGVRKLYIWAQPLENVEDRHLREHLEQITHSYLSVSGFIIRAVIYFAIWALLNDLLSKWSREQDHPPMRDNSERFKKIAGPGIILYAFTISFAVIDWVMSLNPGWISTIYGLLFLAAQVLSAMCFAVLIERILFRYPPMSELLKPAHVHDHGKLMLAFVMLWAYFSFSQWLIMWAGNLPEEIVWYVRRLNGGWGWIAIFLVLFHFAVPFVMLLSRSFKRDVTRLVYLAAFLIFVRYVDLFWHIEPTFSSTLHISISDIVVPVALGGLWLAYFCYNLASWPLLPAYDVYATEVLEPSHER